MRRLFLSLLLPQIFFALSVGSTVTVCQAASVAGVDLHDCQHDHEDHEPHGEAPCDGDCVYLLTEASTAPSVKIPVSPEFCDLFTHLFPNEVHALPPVSPLETLRAKPPAPPSPPLPAVTGRFLI